MEFKSQIRAKQSLTQQIPKPQLDESEKKQNQWQEEQPEFPTELEKVLEKEQNR